MCKQITLFLFAILVATSGWCGSPPTRAGIRLRQWPRFVGVKRNTNVSFGCENYSGELMSRVSWLKASSFGSSTHRLENNERLHISQETGLMFLRVLQTTDSGVYYCEVSGIRGPGSELQVHEPRDLEMTIRRSNMKDAVIFIQALFLGIFLLIPHFCYKQQAEEKETIYEEPEMDHTYEGLDVDHCDLYEDIPAFNEQDGSEPGDSPMEVPDQE